MSSDKGRAVLKESVFFDHCDEQPVLVFEIVIDQPGCNAHFV